MYVATALQSYSHSVYCNKTAEAESRSFLLKIAQNLNFLNDNFNDKIQQEIWAPLKVHMHRVL